MEALTVSQHNFDHLLPIGLYDSYDSAIESFNQWKLLNDSVWSFDFQPEIVVSFPSNYSLWAVIFLAAVMTAIMIVIVVGNMLVIIAIVTENGLSSVQNWFIASLALADMLIGLVIMPFSLSRELMGFWTFGKTWCDIHGAMDVFLCTASIMNICLISLDRYWSITKAVSYLNARTPCKVGIMIITVWILSGLISIPPLLGWSSGDRMNWLGQDDYNLTHIEFVGEFDDNLGNDAVIQNLTRVMHDFAYPQCKLSEDLGYVMYSAFGSFYIPSCIMVFVYIQIYYAAKRRARRNVNFKIRRKSSRRKSVKKKVTVTERIIHRTPSLYGRFKSRIKLLKRKSSKKSKEMKNHVEPTTTCIIKPKSALKTSGSTPEVKKVVQIAGIQKPNQMSPAEIEKEKKRIARKKERRATLILGLIMGSFIACWLPFFFFYVLSPLCPICTDKSMQNETCCVKEWIFTLAFWLGYSNSALNPVIYTIFNKDFRRAFNKIIFK